VPTAFVALVGVPQLSGRVISEATQGSVDIEVAVALDLSGSMTGSIPNGQGGYTTKIASLKTALNQLIELLVQDEQTPTTSRMALVPYSQAVNVGGYANAVRGAIVQPTAITNIAWASGTAKAITDVTKANPAVVTANNHGFVNGDRVYITGVNGMTELNNKIFTVAGSEQHKFQLQGINSSNYNKYANKASGTVTKCVVSTCELVVTSANHGLSAGAEAYISGVNTSALYETYPQGPYTEYESYDNNITWPGGLDDVNYAWINNNPDDEDYAFLVWKIGAVTTNTFVLPGTPRTNGKVYGDYVSGGTVACVVQGCSQYRFTNPNTTNTWYNNYNAANTSKRRHAISTCVTERDVNTFTDTSYLTTLVGRNYASSNNPCQPNIIVPLTSAKGQDIGTNVDKTTLHGVANTLTAAGSTGGQIGVAWAWYLLSGTFNGPWPVASQPAVDDTVRPVAKAVVLMTDGEYNTIYKNGVIAKNSTSGSGVVESMIGENANNGSSYDQTAALCQAMKNAGIIVYTVGLAIDDKPVAKQMMANCASDPSKAYVAGTGQALQDVFADIAGSLSELRLSH
jgi:hypothetical protein